MRVALILPGGSTAGVFEVGVLQELLPHIKPNMFIATSAGAITAGGLLAGIGKQWADLEEGSKHAQVIWEGAGENRTSEVNGKTFGIEGNVYPFNFRSLLGVFGSGGIFKPENLYAFIKTLVEDTTFEDLPYPFYVGTIELDSAKTIFHSSGKLLDPIMASASAIPFFPPHRVNGKLHIDGGLDIGSCIELAAKLGADKIILVNLRKKVPVGKNVSGMVRNLINTLTAKHRDYYIKNGYSELVYELSSLTFIESEFHDASKTAFILEEGRKAARKFLKEHANSFDVVSSRRDDSSWIEESFETD